MATTVVNVRDVNPSDPDVVYIGRKMAYRGRWLRDAGWGNPFKARYEWGREGVLAQYRDYVLANPVLISRLPELRDKRLACWCKPGKGCHGDILVELLERLDEVLRIPESCGRFQTLDRGGPRCVRHGSHAGEHYYA